MSKTQTKSVIPSILLGVVLAIVGLVYFSGSYKVLTILAGVYGLYLLLSRDLTPLRSVPAILLLAYAIFAGLTRFWAISGKFFLIEYSEIFVAAMIFLSVMLEKNFDRSSVRSAMITLTAFSTFYAMISVESAATGVTHSLLTLFVPAYESISVGFEAGTRLTGILGNANILSSVLALGILFSICLMCDEESSKTRMLWTGAAAINVFTFLLLFSMGGIACFAVSVILCLIFSGEQRGSILVRMLECAIPSLAWVFVAFPFYNQSGAALVVPILAMIGNVVTVILLEKLLAPRLVPVLARRGKLALGVLAAMILAVGVYIVAGYNLSGAYTFGDSIQRSAYPEAGTHTLSIQADGDVKVTIISQDMSQIMMHTNTVIYRGNADGAEFTVPEDSEVCYFTFSAAEGVTIEQADLSTGESLKLKYTILPGFIANRLQGLWANQNAIQRTVFFEDGMKMFRQSPLIGNGVGSFETGVSSVQDFYYETKYIHNHYIQILLEAGIVGLIPFLGALVALAWLLLKNRKQTQEHFPVVYPVLWGALAMAALHMMVEVSMSIIIFLGMVFALFALIIRCCTYTSEENAVQPSANEKAKAKSGTKEKIPTSLLAIKGVCAALCAVFVISICCNIAARSIMTSPVSSYENMLNNLATGAKLDPYEANDAKLSYVNLTYRERLSEHIPQANEFATQMLSQQSNSIPSSLLIYYLGTAQYDEAFQSAQAAARYSASNPSVWNTCAAMLHSALFDSAQSSPFINGLGDPQELISMSVDYYRTLCRRNAESMEIIQLAPLSNDYFSKILALAETELTMDDLVSVMYEHIFDSAITCDANGDHVPDLITSHSGMTFLSDGTIQVEKGGKLELSYCEQTASETAQLTVYCSDPQQVTISINNIPLTGSAEGDCVIFEIPTFGDRFSAQSVGIHFASQQTVDRITFYSI